MPTRQDIINKTKQADPSFAGMSDNEIIDLVQEAQPDLLIEEDQGLVEGGVGDFGGAVLGGVDNLLADLTNLTVGQFTGKEYQPIGVTSGLREKKAYGEGGLLKRTAGRLGEFGTQAWAGAKAEVEGKQSKTESAYQMGGEIAKFATGTFGDIVGSTISTVAPDNLEKKVGELVQEGLNETETGQFLVKQMTEFDENMKYLEKNDPEAYRNYRATFGYLEAGAEAVGLKKVSGLYRAGGEIKHIPTNKIKELTQQTTTKLSEAVKQTGDLIKQGKDKTLGKAKNIIETLPKTSKEYQKAVSPSGKEFIVEQTPTIYEGLQDAFASSKNDNLAGGSIFPKLTKGKTTKQKLNANKIALESVEQLYDDKAKGIISADIKNMGGGVEGLDQGLKYWGEKIGEFTDLNDTMNIKSELNDLENILGDELSKLGGDIHGRVSSIVDIFKKNGDYDLSLKKVQNAISEIKSGIFSDVKVINQLSSSPVGRKLSDFLENLQTKFDTTIDSVSGNSAQLKEAKTNYRKYKQIQKDLVDSFLVVQRKGLKGGLTEMAGNMGGVASVLADPSGFGAIKGLLLKQGGELMGRATARDGQWDTLLRNLDRKAVREYNLKKQKDEKMASMDNSNNSKFSDTNNLSNSNNITDNKGYLDSEILEGVQDLRNQINDNIGNKENLLELKEAISEYDLPKKYKEALDEVVDKHIRDVDNYKAEVDSGLKDSVSLVDQYGDSLAKSFNQLEGIQKRTKTTKGGDKMSAIEFETSPAYKKFSDNAQEYMSQRNFDDISVQELFEQMQDMKAGVKFQTKDEPNLMALHNLSKEKIGSIQDLGGMPGPSIAITKSGIPFEDFGDITLVGNKNLVTSSKAKTYDADIYSPRVPQPNYVMKKDAYDRSGELGEGLENYEVKGSDLLNDLEQEYTRNSYGLNLKFANDNNVKFDTEMKSPVSQATFQGSNAIARKDTKDIKQNIPKFNKNDLTNENLVKEMQKVMDKMLGERSPTLTFFDADNFYNYLTSFNKPEVLDRTGTMRNVRDAIESKGLGDQYDDFINNLQDEYFDKKLYKGTTNLGRPSYQEYTLDNVVKKMFKGGHKGNESSIFGGNLPQSIGKEAKPLNVSKMKKVDFAKNEKLDLQYDELKDKWLEISSGIDGSLIDEYFTIKGNPESIAENINTFYSKTKITPDDIKELQSIAKETIALPNSYIETKISRGVDLDEFSYVLVPEDQKDEVFKLLKGTRLQDKIETYKGEGDRTKRIEEIGNKYGDVKFQQKSELIGQGEPIKQAEAKKIVEKYFNADEVGVEFVDKISTLEGLEALGKYRDRLITFSKDPLESTPEHEVLHAFFDTMTSEDRKIKVLSEIKDKQKFDNDLDAEEWLADNFVTFARDRDVSGITENVKQYFSDMLRGLKTIFVEGDVVDNLYRDLEDMSKRGGISKPQAVVVGGVSDEE